VVSPRWRYLSLTVFRGRLTPSPEPNEYNDSKADDNFVIVGKTKEHGTEGVSILETGPAMRRPLILTLPFPRRSCIDGV